MLPKAPGGYGLLYARLMNEFSPAREAYVYEVLRVLGISASLAKVAKINYVDAVGKSGVESSSNSDQFSIERQALIFEKKSNMAKRLGLSFVAEEGDSTKTSQVLDIMDSSGKTQSKDGRPVYFDKMDYQALLAVMYFNVLVGSWDYRAPLYLHNRKSEDRIHNVYVYERPDGKWIPVPYDFDLASMVTAKLGFPSKRILSKGEKIKKLNLENIMRARINWLESEFENLEIADKEALRQSVLDSFRSKRDELYSSLESFPMDEYGRKSARAHLDTFFSLLRPL